MLKEAFFIFHSVLASYSHAHQINEKQLTCLSKAVYTEAGGENTKTKAYIAKFIINQADRDNTTICNEIYQFDGRYSENVTYRKNFRLRDTNDIEKEAWKESVEISMLVLNNDLEYKYEHIDSATNFASPDKFISVPSWYDETKIVYEYGDFVFLNLSS